MRRCISARTIIAAGLLGASSLLAACVGFSDPRLGDAQGKVYDLAQYLAVQRGDEMDGGSTMTGQVEPLGERVLAVGVHATGMRREYPEIASGTITLSGDQVATRYPVTGSSSMGISIGAAVRTWRGFHAGNTRVGELDVLGGVTLHQDDHPAGWSISGAGAITEIGGRLGIVEETRHFPGVAFSLAYRWTPATSYEAPPAPTTGGGSMAMSVKDLDVGVTSWRLAASKRIGAFAVDAGFGEDHNSASYTYSAALTGSGDPANGGDYGYLDVSRRREFIGASWTLRGISVSGEYGRMEGGNAAALVTVGNTFGGDLLRGRSYYSIGIHSAW